VRGGHGLGWSAERVRSVRVRGGCEQNFSSSCGGGVGLNFAGRVRTQNFKPRRTLICWQRLYWLFPLAGPLLRFNKTSGVAAVVGRRIYVSYWVVSLCAILHRIVLCFVLMLSARCFAAEAGYWKESFHATRPANSEYCDSVSWATLNLPSHCLFACFLF